MRSQRKNNGIRYGVLLDGPHAERVEDPDDVEQFFSPRAIVLSGKRPTLPSQIMRMRLLHKHDYSLQGAALEMEEELHGSAVHGDARGWSRHNSARFNELVVEHKKNFVLIARALQTSVAACLVHYYGSFKKTKEYQELKRLLWEEAEKKQDYCAVCHDGGRLICCDSCNKWYHPKCLSMDPEGIPEGDWICPSCERQRMDASSSGADYAFDSQEEGGSLSDDFMDESISYGGERLALKRKKKTKKKKKKKKKESTLVRNLFCADGVLPRDKSSHWLKRHSSSSSSSFTPLSSFSFNLRPHGTAKKRYKATSRTASIGLEWENGMEPTMSPGIGQQQQQDEDYTRKRAAASPSASSAVLEVDMDCAIY